MSKKKSIKKPRRQDTLNSAAVDRRALESSLADIGRLLSEHQSGSIDEANKFIQEYLKSGKPFPSAPRSSQEQAQDVMYQAWDAVGPQRIKLARKALEISADCADAYVLLAEETARTPEEAKPLYEQGVKAGERALGPEVFKEDVGHFWGILETRPYMRARAGLAQCLWAMGEHRQAIIHFTDMLRLNPGDNQGLRYLLATLLLEVGDDKALQALLNQYDDDYSASWKYSSALLAFRQAGKSEKANALLTEAITYNHFVPPYLLGRKKLPHRMPAYISFGDENEAVDYAAGARAAWQKAQGALDWLREILAAIGS
jgi:tetratricopeptide (TPR) repeat protein